MNGVSHEKPLGAERGLLDGGTIAWAGPLDAWSGNADREIDLGRRAVIPGLVDCHTHCIRAGDRLVDFEARAAGVSYERILAAGSGAPCVTRRRPPSRS